VHLFITLRLTSSLIAQASCSSLPNVLCALAIEVHQVVIVLLGLQAVVVVGVGSNVLPSLELICLFIKARQTASSYSMMPLWALSNDLMNFLLTPLVGSWMRFSLELELLEDLVIIM